MLKKEGTNRWLKFEAEKSIRKTAMSNTTKKKEGNVPTEKQKSPMKAKENELNNRNK